MDLFAQFDAAARATRRKHGPLRAEDLETKIMTAVVELRTEDKLSTSRARNLMLAAVVLSACSILFAGAMAFGYVPPFSSGVMRWVVAGAALALTLLWPAVAASLGEMATIDAVARRSLAPKTIPLHEKVGIEPGETYKKFKVVADDLGVMYLDEANRRLLIDCTRHRLSICGKDVRSTALGAVKLGSGVQLRLNVDDAPLDIVISTRSNVPASPDEPLDQRKRLAQRIRGILALPNED